MEEIEYSFFLNDAETVAKFLLGKILEFDGKKARIVETEAYLDENDPASRASKGKNKVSDMMKEEFGKILIYNVHKYYMLNFVTREKGVANAVLIRALEPLNFEAKTSGPGLLTIALGIDKKLNGQILGQSIKIFGDKYVFDTSKSFRIGVSKDSKRKLRFFIEGNKFVSNPP
jgi:DNA-3-methyladenine glycosylase